MNDSSSHVPFGKKRTLADSASRKPPGILFISKSSMLTLSASWAEYSESAGTEGLAAKPPAAELAEADEPAPETSSRLSLGWKTTSVILSWRIASARAVAHTLKISLTARRKGSWCQMR